MRWYIYDENVITTVFRLRIVNSICTSSDEKDTGEKLLAVIEDWEILEEESCSDHNIIKYKLHFNINRAHAYNFQGPRFITREQ